jgi:DNA-directed RNA polymerase subunit RPC12/RpoP
MAEGVRYVCGNCHRAIEAWSDGNPYYLDDKGAKKYAYHPSPEVERCIGNDSPYLCLACGKKFMVDSRAPIERCPKCKSSEIVACFDLDGQQCPYCKSGLFTADPDFGAIS